MANLLEVPFSVTLKGEDWALIKAALTNVSQQLKRIGSSDPELLRDSFRLEELSVEINEQIMEVIGG